MLGTTICPFCGESYGGQSSCPGCSYRYMEFLTNQNLPNEIQKRFFYPEDYQELYLLAKKLREGKISAEEKDQKVSDKWHEILERQKTILEREQRSASQAIQDSELL